MPIITSTRAASKAALVFLLVTTSGCTGPTDEGPSVILYAQERQDIDEAILLTQQDLADERLRPLKNALMESRAAQPGEEPVTPSEREWIEAFLTARWTETFGRDRLGEKDVEFQGARFRIAFVTSH